MAPKQKEVEKRKKLRPGLQKAKKQHRERVLTARAVAAGKSKVRFTQGLLLYDRDSGDGGQHFVLYKREKRRLEIEDGPPLFRRRVLPRDR
jgi:hypothetical protein